MKPSDSIPVQRLEPSEPEPYGTRVAQTYAGDPQEWRKALGERLLFQWGICEHPQSPRPVSLDEAGERYFERQLELAGLSTGRRTVNRILDLGCGWGYLLGLMADRFPEARVDGVNMSGQSSVDMGIAALNSGHSIATAVTTYGKAGTVAVKGSSRAASGADLCKSGRTTGWTCGKVKSYNATVNYGNTTVSGLASSTVCSEGGDSGGAYISGHQAQGMTSGGPSGQKCTGGVYSQGTSYFQPLDDALRRYSLTLNTN
ncbi:hypothetical protein GCM10017752_67630 [Streptomyces roseoviridis]